MKKKLWDHALGITFPSAVKILLKMKLTVCVILFSFFGAIASESYSQTTKLSLDLKNATVKDALGAIESQSDFFFLYSEKIINVNRKVNIEVQESRIEKILDKIFEDTNVNYTVKGRQIILTTPEANFFDRLSGIQQQKSISGKVTDSSGRPLPGATIVIKGTTSGTITDINGQYLLSNIPEKAILRFSFIGMKTVEYEVGSNPVINVELAEETVDVEEVVAIGYGTVKKSDLTGSVGIVSKNDIGDRISTSLGSLIQGKVPGIDVQQDKIRIRGVTTLNSTDPLIIVDGFAGESMGTVNPNDIESIEILKDASSTAIYGSRGANGVILVTTKSGKAGPLKVNFNVQTGINSPSKKLDLLNASQYSDYAIEALTNARFPVSDRLRSNDVRIDRTDWQDEILRNGANWEANIDFSGGSENSTYLVSAGYRKSEPPYINRSNDAVFLKIKNDFQLRKWIKMGESVSLSYNIESGLDAGAVTLPWYTSLPYLPVKDPNNYWGYGNVDRINDLSDSQNPVAYTMLTQRDRRELQFTANWWTEISPIKGLVYRIQVGALGGYSRYTNWRDKLNDNAGVTQPAQYTEKSTHNVSPVLESYLTYSNKIQKHEFSVMVGNYWRNYGRAGGIGVYGEGFELSTVKNVFSATTKSVLNQDYYYSASLSYFGRLNYQYNNRYLLTVNMRRDGSPRFAPAYRWGTFPSVAIAWKMNEEEFIKNLNLFDILKLRVSWGISGNDAIGEFRYLSKVWQNGVYYPLGSPSAAFPGATVSTNSSQGIKWESAESKSLGLDMGFLNNTLTASVEYFVKNANDILFSVPRASSLGYGLTEAGNATVNAASVDNKGFELQVGYRNRIGEFNYSINANYSNIENKVTSLGLGQPYLVQGFNRTEMDYPIGYLWGYLADGLFMTQAELDASNQSARNEAKAADPSLTTEQLSKVYYQLPQTSAGDVRFKDVDGNGRVTGDDRTMMGNSIPKHIFGFSLDLAYKGFSLNAFFQGNAGNDILNFYYQHMRGMLRTTNQTTEVLNRWKSESDPGNGTLPRAVIGDPAENLRYSSLLVFPGDYLKLKQLSLGYTFNDRWVSKIGLNKLRVYASGYNLLTFTKYPFFDPEIAARGNLDRAQDNSTFPSARTMLLGIQLGF